MPFLTDLAEIAVYQGIPLRHLEAILGVAIARNEVIGIRPVELAAKGLLEAGYPTKKFSIKGKSANWGPQAGFIAVNQWYSKAAGNSAKVAKYNAEVAKCMAAGDAIAVQLTLSKERILELAELATGDDGSKCITIVNISADWKTITLQATGPDKKIHEFIAEQNADGEFAIFINSDEGVSPLMVLAHPELEEALTADLDLLTIAPEIGSYGGDDKNRLPDATHESFCLKRTGTMASAAMASFRAAAAAAGDPDVAEGYLDDALDPGVATGSSDAARSASTSSGSAAHIHRLLVSKDSFLAEEHPTKGNVSPRVLSVIDAINSALARGEGRDAVHHAADETNPFSDPESNFPAMFFIPKPVTITQEDGCTTVLEGICMVETPEDLLLLIQALKDVGYHVKCNPRWGKEFTELRSESFRNALRVLSELLATRAADPSVGSRVAADAASDPATESASPTSSPSSSVAYVWRVDSSSDLFAAGPNGAAVGGDNPDVDSGVTDTLTTDLRAASRSPDLSEGGASPVRMRGLFADKPRTAFDSDGPAAAESPMRPVATGASS